MNGSLIEMLSCVTDARREQAKLGSRAGGNRQKTAQPGGIALQIDAVPSVTIFKKCCCRPDYQLTIAKGDNSRILTN